MADSQHISILHVSTPKSWRGGEQQLAYLFDELEKLQVRQAILCTRDSAMESRCGKAGWSHYTAPKSASIDPRFARKLAKVARLIGATIVHTHDSHAHTFAMMAAKLFGLKAKIIVSRRVDFPINSLKKYNHPQVARILCVSDAIKAITGKDIEDQRKLVTVHSGIDLSRFEGKQATGILRREFSIPADELLIGNVAALAPHKDYFTFIDTAKVLIEQGIQARFLAIGGGDLEGELKQYAKQKGVSEHILFTGFRKDIPSIFPELDLFLITSETEGLGTSILDALACQVPVVATEAGGIPEAIIHEKTGLSAPIKAPKALATQVQRMIKDQSLRNEMIRGATEHLKQFTKAATARKTMEIYREISSE